MNSAVSLAYSSPSSINSISMLDVEHRRRRYRVWYHANADRERSKRRAREAQRLAASTDKEREAWRERQRQYYRAYRIRHRERLRERQRLVRLQNPEPLRRRCREWAQRRRTSDLEGVRQEVREWQATHRENTRQIALRWARNHPDKARDLRMRRHAREKGAPIVEKVDRIVVYTRDGGICHLCGIQAPRYAFHLDHIVPLARGGSHAYANVAVSHPFCNLSKRDRV